MKPIELEFKKDQKQKYRDFYYPDPNDFNNYFGLLMMQIIELVTMDEEPLF